MKKLFITLNIVFINLCAFAQYDTAPQTMSYQAIIRDYKNTLIQNGPVGIKISILDQSVNGPATYVEVHTKQTNQNGLLDLQIGGGTVVSGVFLNGIYWGQPHFLKTEIDPLGGTNYTIISTSELLSVPLSNYAHVSAALHGPAWNFVGAYKQFNQNTNNILFYGYSSITYVGVDKVIWTFRSPGGYYSNNADLSDIDDTILLYGTVVGNMVTFDPQDIGIGQNTGQIQGTLVGNDLTLSDSSGTLAVMVKQ